MKAVLVIFLAFVAITAGCIGQQPMEEIHILEKDGVEYEFSTDVREAAKIEVIGETQIFDSIALANNVSIIFREGGDNAIFAKAGFDLTNKLQFYYVYTQDRIVGIRGFEMVNASMAEGTIIEFIGPTTGANETSVSLQNETIIVRGTTNQTFALAVDRLALVLFPDDVQAILAGER